ncbi:MAG: CotH kinase family protein [Bacteroidetes bacterium]|nr:CotH kinase family protein [Bacteroidota bacterium]MBU1797480.1 CotH kinase family protein [Bacteroidota bacterium]
MKFKNRMLFKNDTFRAIFFAVIFFVTGNFNAQSLFINEFMASNVTSTPEIVDFDAYSDWIEIYNDSTSSINIGGYYLTDNLGNPTKWRIPDGTIIASKGFLMFWADGFDSSPSAGSNYYHTNFSLSKDGEELGLFSPEQIMIDSVIFGIQISDVSFGRNPNSGNDWNYFGEPTPNKSNLTNGTLSTEFSNNPNISLVSGIYSGAQNISISANFGAEIRYTLDGSMPKSASLKYENPINISKTTTLRVRVFENDKLPSKVITRAYFIDEPQNLAILSLTAFPETLFDDEIGIYLNEIKSREVPVNVQLFEKNGEKAFEVDAGLRLTGQASFQYPQKPLTIETDNKFGEEVMDYPIFANRPFENYISLYLRNSGTQDNRHTMFRDALQHTIVINQMDLDCQAYRPAATYINGKYWGIYNLREKLDDNYLIAHHNVDPKNVDYLEYEFSPLPNVVEGSADEYYALQSYLSTNSMNIKEKWDYVKSQIDVNEVMNYLITEIYCDNVNWPYTNSKWWKEKSENGKWRYIFLDSDYGFGAPSFSSHYSNNTLDFLYDQAPYSTFIFRKLFENNEFKNEFIQRFATYLNTIFKKERVVGIVDSLKNQISAEMVYHIDRWDDDTTPIYGYPPIPDMDTWNMEVEIMREFAEKRPQYMKQSLLDFYSLTGVETLQFSLSSADAGTIYLGDIKVNNGFTGEYFRYIPLKIEAIPKVGFKFVKWSGVDDSLSQVANIIPTRTSAKIITAVFEEDNASVLPSIVSENTTLTTSGSPYLAKGDIIVNSGITLTFEPGVELLMPAEANLVVNGILQMNGTLEQPIIIRPNETSGFNNWGIIYLENASGQCLINNVKLIGATNGKILPNQMGAISSYKSNITIENTTILDAPFPIFIQYGNAIVRNCTLHSEEISDLINIKYAESALVENCDFRGNNAIDSDAIDYDQITNGIIRGNKIYNFYGFNSDGIDIGEGSKNLLIENNQIFNINDKAISVGQASTVSIKRNIIANCAQGVGIKDDSSFAFVDRNTFSGCDIGVASFEKNIGAGGGNAEIVNSIFTNSITSPVFVDNLSKLTVNYSLSNTTILEGTGNINANPLLTNNFILNTNSPAINSGNPTTELDDDGTIADLGAKQSTGIFEPLVINEIHYNPSNGDNYEFIEIYNTSTESIITSGIKIKGAIDFEFPSNSFIAPKEYQIIAKDKSVYENNGFLAYQWNEGNLPNTWGNIQIIDVFGKEIDFVSYSNKFIWPTEADGNGKSLEFRNPLDENLIATNWKASDNFGGSPASANKPNYENLLHINEFQADNNNTIKDEFGENDDWIEIYNASDHPINIAGLYISDKLSNPTKHLIASTNAEKTTIYAKGYLLLWADGTTEQGENHLSIKLSDTGEDIGLFSIFENDTTIISSITFGKQNEDFSYERINDGDENWQIAKVPTPGKPNNIPNLFEKGILLVNGFPLNIAEVVDSYQSKAFWGKYNISFWDAFAEPNNGYPSNLPAPNGHGVIPFDTLSNYSTVIWTSENNSLELSIWQSTPILDYVKHGGNLILMVKNGRSYFNSEMFERLGITWIEPQNATIANCIPVFANMDSISLKATQYINAIFDTTLTSKNSKLLFSETASHGKPVGIGVWNKPPYGGYYRENGGQIIYLSGRAYRYNNDDLKNNIEYMLEYFLEESELVSVDDFENNQIITEYNLSQNYPNPFNPSTIIKYDLLKSGKVELKIFNILGQEVKTLVNNFEEKGRKSITWNGENNFNQKVSSGIYFYRISSENWSDIKKMIFLK